METKTNKTKKSSSTSEEKKTKTTLKNKTKTTTKNNETAKAKTTVSKNSSSKAKTVKKTECKNIKVLGFHDLELNTFVYDNVEKPKAVVIIVHGMMEHCLRYKDFANYLNKNGFIVVASDLRGHGKTALSKEKLGFGEKDIFEETIQDQLNLIEYANETFNLPIYVFGHSYGSMLTQVLVQRSSLIEKTVICGTANGSSSVMKLGNCVACVLAPFKKEDSMGGIIEKLCIKSYGKNFENGNWLTKDEKVFEEYKKDEYCGGSFPFSFYKNLFKNMTKANNGIQKIGSKKLFLIAGDKDPVGSCGKQVKKLFNIYLKNNVDAKIKIYPNDRHELINETNKSEVWQDVVDFYNN